MTGLGDRLQVGRSPPQDRSVSAGRFQRVGRTAMEFIELWGEPHQRPDASPANISHYTSLFTSPSQEAITKLFTALIFLKEKSSA